MQEFTKMLHNDLIFVVTSGLLFACMTRADKKICLGGLKWYSPETQDCKSGQVVNKTISTTPPVKQEDSELTKHPIPHGKSDVTATPPYLDCQLSVQLVETPGRQCCGGFETYNPSFDTCCMRNLKVAVVHKGKKEKSHICCTGRSDDLNIIYPRGSREIPCKHPSLNDKFWTSAKSLIEMTKYCKAYNYAYLIRVRKKTTGTISSFYKATMRRWSLKNPSNRKTTFSAKDIAIDKYSPRRKLSRKLFVILTDNDYSSELDFYLDFKKSPKEDMVFKGPKKQSKFRKNFRQILRKCNAQKSVEHLPGR